jgi:hypothetical protein
MSGASSAYLNGHIANVPRLNPKRKVDYDISELLELCSKPISQDDRILNLQNYGALYPELKNFLLVAYYYKGAFKQLNSTGIIDYIPSKVIRGSSVETLASTWREITRLYDSFPSGPKIKRGIAQRLLSEVSPEDGQVIIELLTDKFYSKELNETVVAKAFPGDIPTLPNA